MVCKAEGSPEPLVEWRKDNQLAGDGFGQSEALLVLRGVLSNDAGLYTCLAQNAVGTDLQITQVLVRCKYFITNNVYYVRTFHNFSKVNKKRVKYGPRVPCFFPSCLMLRSK